MSAIAAQITSLTIVYSTVYLGADQSKHQSSASLAFVCGIHRGPVNSPHKWPVTRKMFPFDDVIMITPPLLQGTDNITTVWPMRVYRNLKNQKMCGKKRIKRRQACLNPSFLASLFHFTKPFCVAVRHPPNLIHHGKYLTGPLYRAQ